MHGSTGLRVCRSRSLWSWSSVGIREERVAEGGEEGQGKRNYLLQCNPVMGCSYRGFGKLLLGCQCLRSGSVTVLKQTQYLACSWKAALYDLLLRNLVLDVNIGIFTYRVRAVHQRSHIETCETSSFPFVLNFSSPSCLSRRGFPLSSAGEAEPSHGLYTLPLSGSPARHCRAALPLLAGWFRSVWPWLAGRWQRSLSHKRPTQKLRGGRTRGAHGLQQPQPHRLPWHDCAVWCLLLQR